MVDVYDGLIKERSSLKDAQEVDYCSLDTLLSSERVKLGSVDDLFSFHRVSKDVLVHKAEKDLWSIGEDKKGNVIIQRLFKNDTNEPIKI